MTEVVSAIVPTHNRDRCLPRAIESILAQEGAGELFEVEPIVVDDGSTDSTAEVVRRYPEVRYVRLPTQSGVSAALNRGVEASTGVYISFLGDDDEWLPHKLRVQVPVLAADPGLAVVYGQAIVRTPERERLYPTLARARSGWVFFDMLMDNFCGHHAAFLARRAAVEEAGGFDEALSTCEDFDLSLRLARRSRFLFVPGEVTVYNLSAQGRYLTHAATGAAAEDARKVIEKSLATLPDSPSFAEVKRAARARADLEATWSLAMSGDLVRARERLVATFASHPWAIDHDWARRYVREFAVEGVREGRPAVTVVRELFLQIRAVTRPRPGSLRWWVRLLAEMQLRALRLTATPS